MFGVILAAGVGSRLRPMTNAKPKCLVTTAGKTILQYQIDAYRNAGIRDLIIVVGYEGDAIRDYCKHIKDIKIKIIENADYENTNNMYSLYLAKSIIFGESFILNNADLSIDPEIVKNLLEFKAADAVAVDSSLYNEESMKVRISDNGYIIDISKTIKKIDSHACSIDFYKFSAESGKVFFDEITRIIEEEENLKDWTEVAMQRLFQTQRLRFMPCDIAGFNWVEIDNYEDLAHSDRIFSKWDDRINLIENIVFDLDGTLYVGGKEVNGAGLVVKELQEKGKNIFFLSNNSSRSKLDYVDRLRKIGIEISVSQIILSTDGLIDYLSRNRVSNIHVLGTKSLKKQFIDEGFNIDSSRPEYVVVGYDTELNYQKLITACKYINEGTDILATHPDIFCPSEVGPLPDIGALLEMLKMTTGKTPKKIFGKPSEEMIAPLIERFDIDPKKTVIVGDRLYTDVLMAKNVGCYSLLVLTGETTRDQVEGSKVVPDFILPSVAEF